jgi:hypothetical protein
MTQDPINYFELDELSVEANYIGESLASLLWDKISEAGGHNLCIRGGIDHTFIADCRRPHDMAPVSEHGPSIEETLYRLLRSLKS